MGNHVLLNMVLCIRKASHAVLKAALSHKIGSLDLLPVAQQLKVRALLDQKVAGLHVVMVPENHDDLDLGIGQALELLGKEELASGRWLV